MYCKNCGNQIITGDRFCSVCGTAVETPTADIKKVMVGGVEMSADDMLQYCMDNNMLKLYDWDKPDRALYRKFFETAIGELQYDETVLLVFWGQHQYKSVILQAGIHAYVLTDKRLLAVGFSNSKGALFNPVGTWVGIAKVLVKNAKYTRYSIYLRDIISVDADMIGGHDVITFHTTKENMNVMFWSSNITHQLCDKIKVILQEYRNNNQK